MNQIIIFSIILFIQPFIINVCKKGQKLLFMFNLSAILKLALNRVDISTLTSLFFDDSIISNFCYFYKTIDQVNWSIEQALNF